MKSIEGDLLGLAVQGRFDVVVHGANCQCVMRAGIAKSIRALFPEANEADDATRKGDRAKLGSISVAEVVRGSVHFHVVNAYTQFDYRGPGTRVDYDAVRAAMKLVKQRFPGRRIGYPRIGAGLGRGDWARLAQIIDEELLDEDHTLVEFVARRDQAAG
jgi:O-acetyl-ADP-ribose deacetylase (regulator of RNase III)